MKVGGIELFIKRKKMFRLWGLKFLILCKKFI